MTVCGHGAVVHRSGQDPARRVALRNEALLGRQPRHRGKPALQSERGDLLRLRELGALSEPGLDRGQFDLGAGRIEVIFGAGDLVQRPVGLLGEHRVDALPVLAIDRGEQRLVPVALGGAEEGGNGGRIGARAEVFGGAAGGGGRGESAGDRARDSATYARDVSAVSSHVPEPVHSSQRFHKRALNDAVFSNWSRPTS